MKGKVIDVTFHGGRQQSEILKEIDSSVTSVSGEPVIEDVDDSFIPDVVTHETIKIHSNLWLYGKKMSKKCGFLGCRI